MLSLALTGGVATGKSTFARILLREFSAYFFDSDLFVHELLLHDESVKSEIRSAFGEEVLDESGSPDRVLLRSLIFSDDKKKAAMEAIIHPRVKQGWFSAHAEAKKKNRPFIADIPLLFETSNETNFDYVVVVAASFQIQIQRLETNRGIESALAKNILHAQMDMDYKIRHSDHVIWNDGAVSNLDGQTRIFANLLNQRVC